MARVLMVVRGSEGGVFEHVSGLAAELQRRGHTVAICGPHEAHAASLEVEVLPLEMVRPISPVADARTVAGLRRIVRRFEPDLVHSHGSKGGVLARAVHALRPRTPSVHSPHGYAFAGYFTSSASRLAYRLAELAMAPLTTRLICVCEAEAALARRVAPASRIRVVYNGIDPPADVVVDARVAELATAGPVVGAIGGLRPGKGVETLVESFARVRADLPEAQLVIAGDGPGRAPIEARLRALGARSGVTLLGDVPDPYAVLAGLDAFACPSWAESFPYSVLEAMAMEAPIVATRVGGIPEAIRDGEGGLLVPPRDEAALSGAIVALLSDPARAHALAAQAAGRFKARFTLSEMVDGVLGVYAELIETALDGPSWR